MSGFIKEISFCPKDHLLICFIFSATLLQSSSLCVVWERGVCPVASKSTVYLLCITLLLLPAHVCLGFLDWSPGRTDHTCGIRELSTHSSSTAREREREKKVRGEWGFWWTLKNAEMHLYTDMWGHKVKESDCIKNDITNRWGNVLLQASAISSSIFLSHWTFPSYSK